MINLKDANWAIQATKTARTVALFAFALSALLIGVLLLERTSFSRDNDDAVENVKSALVATNNILLFDEKLTMSANLAAATGEEQWVKRYETYLPAIDAAISTAIALAPPEAAKRFDEETRNANDRLVAMERKSFNLVAKNNLQGAREILDSAEYTKQKTILAKGTETFLQALHVSVYQRRDDLNRRARTIQALLIALAAVCFYAMWGLLNRHLTQSELAFKTKQDEITQLALHDTLTGLPNRRYLYLQLPSMIAYARRLDARFALLLLDLNDFKPINDNLGHEAGDDVLKEIGRRLTTYIRLDEFAARLGGDEFVVTLNGNSNDDFLLAAHRLVGIIEKHIGLKHGMTSVGVSIGIAVFPTDATDLDELIRKADVALYRAKENPEKNAIEFYQPK